MYGYGLEEILPVVIYLTNKYTSGESSSVPYEKAEMLMEAVLYCIRECFTWNTAGVLPAVNSLSARQAYDKGYEYVTEKVKMARGLYDGLITDFEDYGCLNYRKTVLEGLPAFFLKYDIRFCPQDHILTLDYPDMVRGEAQCGAERFTVICPIFVWKRGSWSSLTDRRYAGCWQVFSRITGNCIWTIYAKQCCTRR